MLGVVPKRVPRKCGDLLHAGVPPDDDLIQAVAVRADYLVHRAAPHQIAHLQEMTQRDSINSDWLLSQQIKQTNL